jgi:uncharacterized repeat protein (TIGR01451 family)
VRARFADQQLHPDFIEILQQWGWPGNREDFFAAGLTNKIIEWPIPVGETMPFMASREEGKPVCLRNVTWAGPAPIPAYAFTFLSNSHRYRCIMPKPCSNFYLVDLGVDPLPGLAVDCAVPGKVVAGHTVEVCLNVLNTGNLPEPQITVTLPVPAATTVTATTDGGVVTNQSVVWTLTNLGTNAVKEVGAVFKTQKPGTLFFSPAAAGATAQAVSTDCATEVTGIPAILLKKADDPDPVAIGTTTTYAVKVTNQGTADDANVQIVVTLAPELVPVSSAEGRIDGQTVTLPAISQLAPKDVATYKIVARGVMAGDGHTKFTLSSDVLKSPISAEESTTVY